MKAKSRGTSSTPGGKNKLVVSGVGLMPDANHPLNRPLVQPAPVVKQIVQVRVPDRWMLRPVSAPAPARSQRKFDYNFTVNDSRGAEWAW